MKFEILVFIFFYWVNYVLSETSFIPKGQRAEIFELTDNEVPAFRITLPKDDYKLLKLKANSLSSDFIEKVNNYTQEIIEVVNKQNFTEIFPGCNFKEILPELPINEYGHPNIDYEKFVININDLHSLDVADAEKTFQNIYVNNSYLNLNDVFHTLYNLKKSSKVDKEFVNLINEFENGEIKYDFIRFAFGSTIVNIDNNSPTQTGFDNNSSNYDYDFIDFENFNTKDFIEYFKNYDFNKKKDNIFNINEKKGQFKTKNATLIVEINNEKKIFDKVTFSLGGFYTREFSKPGYNLKIRGGKELFGRRQFKLRGDFTEPTYMRTKLVSDIRNRIGMPSLSANYATLYINDEYLGLFILTDIYKESWIEYVYGEKDTQLLYECYGCLLNYQYRTAFENENKEATNNKELYEFLAEMTKAKSASDVESIFDLDQYYKEIAVDVLVSSWDHTIHNYYIYKNKENNKWVYLSHDYDLDMGIYRDPYMSLYDLTSESPVIDKLVSDDNPRFRKIMKEIVTNVFNPATLYPHIDEIKSFIRPYVKLDKTPDENGQYPGRLNELSSDDFTFEQWEDSIEFENINDDIYGLKEFILLKYRMICQEYDLECDPIYLDENSDKTVNGSNDDVAYGEPNNKKEQVIDDFEIKVDDDNDIVLNVDIDIPDEDDNDDDDIVLNVDINIPDEDDNSSDESEENDILKANDA